ncbi:MAG: nitroreductase family protein [Thermoprotei archaeon]
MDVFEAVNTRLEVREFSDKPVPDEVKLRVLETARLSPSGVNTQHWRFITCRQETGARGAC